MAQAKAKSNSVVTTEWSGDILTLTVLGAGAVMFDRTAASAANRDWAEKHGWTQRLSNLAAIAAPVRAKGLSEEQWLSQLAGHTAAKYERIAMGADYYEKGDVPWKMGATGAGAEGSLLFRALCELRTDKTEEQLRKFLDSRTTAQLAQLRKIKELVEIMNRLRSESAADVDVSEALSDLDMPSVDEEISQLMTDE